MDPVHGASGVSAQTANGAAAKAHATREEIKRAAAGIEEALLRTMLQAMAKAQLESGSFFGQGAAEGTEQTTFEMLLTESLSKGAPLGMADQVADQLSRRDEGLARAAELARIDATDLPLRAAPAGSAVLSIPRGSVQKIHTGPSRSGNPVR